MSADSESTVCCASCGKAEVDEIKLKKCACNLVKYCGVNCQKNHRSLHKRACKKRLAELRDDRLFTQPDGSCYGECPICCLPLPIDMSKSTIRTCCSKIICNGCRRANFLREMQGGLEHKCPFCREPSPNTQKESDKYSMKRIKANDPAALREMGIKCYDEGDCGKAFNYYTKAADLGDVDAHHNLSVLYREEAGVEKDKKKEVSTIWKRLQFAVIPWQETILEHMRGSMEGMTGQ